MRIVVLGLGSVLMRDDGIGVHLVRALSRDYDFASTVEIIDGGTSGMELLPELSGCDHLIVIDAVRANLAPGEIICLRDEQVPAFFKTKFSPHQAGLPDMLAALAFQGSVPHHVVLLGIQPEDLSSGMQLSECLTNRFDTLLDAVLHELSNCGIAPLSRA